MAEIGIKPHRPLEDDLKIQAMSMSYGGTSTSVVVPAKPSANGHACACHSHAGEPAAPVLKPATNGFPTLTNGLPDFKRMDVAQRLAYHRDRLGLGR